MKVRMIPDLSEYKSDESGMKRVVEAYTRYLPQFGVEFVNGDSFDLLVSHAGASGNRTDVSILAGMYWTADLACSEWEYGVNANIAKAVRSAKEIIVPSQWVAETIRRDLRVNPHIVPHGIEWGDWQGHKATGNYVLWNKNRSLDVCDPTPVAELAKLADDVLFMTTFYPKRMPPRPNVHVTGLMNREDMKVAVQEAMVYLATTKETFGIGTLEAMASGVPILGFRHGGTADIVIHGETGYLADPYDYQDLAEGLKYCIQYRSVLSENARAAAKKFTWEAACKMVYDILNKAMINEKPTVGVVIPVYNKPAYELRRAIDSVLGQTVVPDKIVVVDDGSSNGDDLSAAVGNYGDRVVYLRQSNQGVANARNNGIRVLDTKYICPLDADDWLAPAFLETCVRELEADRSLGIAYTGLYWHKPDGTHGLSPWPGEWNYDRFLVKQNQVPTCCVYRKEMWKRLGGYRQRYAPLGAGAEDAEFFLRAGAYGWGGKKATAEGLFHYSWMSGLVTGNPEYKETDWLAWHPWAKDGKHPFASHAKPVGHQSHAVRQYDEPVISVVIPVGAGHENRLIDALDSLEAQTFRKWEAIVVWDNPSPLPPGVLDAYPYVIWSTDKVEKYGAGAARNRGAKLARGNFLLFLDADDQLHPECMEKMIETWRRTGSAVYSDYVGVAIINDPGQLSPELKRNLMSINDRTGEYTFRYSAKDYDCALAALQPENPPYLWCNITTLVPRAWHIEIGGFDEELPSWEDVEYWYRMSWSGKCFERIPEPLLLYRFSTGHRRDRGGRNWDRLLKYITDKKKGIEIMGCGCSKNPDKTSGAVISGAVVGAARGSAVPSDGDYTMAIYTYPSMGKHPVHGATGSKRYYGYRKYGDVFLVHRDDFAAYPDRFAKYSTDIEVPKVDRGELKEPRLA